MKRIILHWTAGSHFPTFFERQFYHFLVDVNGKIHQGLYPPEANLDVKTGRYAAHCGGGNTGSIGVSLCGMGGFESRDKMGKYPLSRAQCEAAFELCARLCEKYRIPVSRDCVLTHYEFGLKNPKSSSAGKIDINFLPPFAHVEAKNVGDFIRSKVNWYRLKPAA